MVKMTGDGSGLSGRRSVLVVGFRERLNKDLPEMMEMVEQADERMDC